MIMLLLLVWATELLIIIDRWVTAQTFEFLPEPLTIHNPLCTDAIRFFIYNPCEHAPIQDTNGYEKTPALCSVSNHSSSTSPIGVIGSELPICPPGHRPHLRQARHYPTRLPRHSPPAVKSAASLGQVDRDPEPAPLGEAGQDPVELEH